jgi:unsaturated chondroitin disaccharide hydrolase
MAAAFAHSSDVSFRDAALASLANAQTVLRQPALQNHDVGFQFMPGAVGLYKADGNQEGRNIGLRGADILRARFLYNGNIIQSWSPQPDYSATRNREVVGKTIIDTMMNVSLLYWASQETGDSSFAYIASLHVTTTIAHLVRTDGSTFHHYKFDPFTGAAIGGMTGQGYSNSSCWSRGQGWALHGLANAAAKAGRADFLTAAIKVATFIETKLPTSKVALWDYSLPSPTGQPVDSSAAAVTICGLHMLADLLTGTAAARWRNLANAMLLALISKSDRSSTLTVDGLLSNGAGNVPSGRTNEVLIFGDFFYLEALRRATGTTAFCW